MFTGFEFKYPHNIFFLFLAIATALFFVLSFHKKENIMALLHLHYKVRMKALRLTLLFVGLVLMVLALMGPQVFTGYAEAEKIGMDIYVLMDTSKSMLVSDIKPDRISVAKKIVENLLENLEGDRIGFIPFASGAYIQMPLTDDYQLARMFLNVIDTDLISGGGTNIAAAVRLAHDSFERVSDSDRVIIIISDGEEHDGASLNLINEISDDRLKIFTIGIGTEKGGLVPIFNNAGDTIIDYIRDEAGNPVTSRLSPEVLSNLAQRGNGSFYQASAHGNEISSLISDLSLLKRDVQTFEKIRRFMHLYQYFLGAGIFVFLTAWFLPEMRSIS